MHMNTLSGSWQATCGRTPAHSSLRAEARQNPAQSCFTQATDVAASALPAFGARLRCSNRHASSRASRIRCRAIDTPLSQAQLDQLVRRGDSEVSSVDWQASKREDEQLTIASYLGTAPPPETVDVCVVGCGPAGLTLSAALAERGLSVCLVGPESKFTNNYGVWVDEFSALGLSHLLDVTWDESLCYFLNQEKRLSRAYGRVDRCRMRDHLLSRCAQYGVAYLPYTVTEIDAPRGSKRAIAHTGDGAAVNARIVTLAGGAPSGKFLRFESNAPTVASQTAYGITARVEGYADVYDPKAMLFMDYRRTHSGMWDGTGAIVSRNNHGGEVNHPNWNANLGSCAEAPSFLYAMPLPDGQVFLEETCLVARPTLPFAVLKRRLYRRCAAMGITIKEVTDEEFSFIPVGGPMPCRDQAITAFGAAANLVHPATGYSITRMLEESGPLADAMANTLKRQLHVHESATEVWDALWPQEKRRQASFHIFGMELLATLDVQSMHEFFETFFRLPDRFWRGFLASKLSSVDLMTFALLMFIKCSMNIRGKLMSHLLTNPAGRYLLRTYTKEMRGKLPGSKRQLH